MTNDMSVVYLCW